MSAQPMHARDFRKRTARGQLLFCRTGGKSSLPQNAKSLAGSRRIVSKNLQIELSGPDVEKIPAKKNIHWFGLSRLGRVHVRLEYFPMFRRVDIEIGRQNQTALFQHALRFAQVKKRFFLHEMSEDGDETNHVGTSIDLGDFWLEDQFKTPGRLPALLRREFQHLGNDIDPEVTNRITELRLRERPGKPPRAAADINQVIAIFQSVCFNESTKPLAHRLVLTSYDIRHGRLAVERREKTRHRFLVRRAHIGGNNSHAIARYAFGLFVFLLVRAGSEAESS